MYPVQRIISETNMMLSKSLYTLKLKPTISTVSSLVRFKSSSNIKNIVTINKDTLTGRLFLYLNRNNEFTARSMQSVDTTHDILQKINSGDIGGLETYIMGLHQRCKDNSFTDKEDLLSILNCASNSQLKLLPTYIILRLLNIFMYTTTNITENNFYKLAMKQLQSHLFLMDKNELLTLLFFLALRKRNRYSTFWITKCLQRLEKDFNSFTIEELCIICNSTFKTSTKINNSTILDKIKYSIAHNLVVLDDPALFIALIKTIRHNKCQDDNILSTISSALLFNRAYDHYSFMALCHVLCLYADYFYHEQKLFDITIQQCLSLLKASINLPIDTYVNHKIRSKDITRFLWVLSNMDYKLSRNDLAFISSKIMERIFLKEYNDSENIVKCILYLWMLNYQSVDIIKYYFQKEKLDSGMNSNQEQSLNLLLTCMRNENPDLYTEINEKPIGLTSSAYEMKRQIRQRTSLQRILNVLKSKSSSLNLNRFEYTCEIPYLNIVGITGFKKRIYKCLYIEVLDNFTTLRNTKSSLNGPMALKLRLLNTMDGNVLKVEEYIIESMTEKQLEDYLKSEINAVILS